MKEVGKVTHYFGKVGAAIVELSALLEVGDKIKIIDGQNEFEQTVDSMQVEREPVKQGKKGDQVGIKVLQPVSEKAVIFKAE